MEYRVDRHWNKHTVLSFMKGRLCLSRGCIAALKQKENGILLDGSPVTVRAVLYENAILTLALADDASENEILPVNLPLSVLFEDDDVLAVNKSAGMPTHPSHGHYEDTLANAVCYYYLKKGIPFVFRAINRLDRDTSGVVLIAKNRHAASILAGSMQNHEFDKNYIAVVTGVMPAVSGTIERHIKRKLPSIIERVVCSEEEGETAVTEYKVLRVTEQYSVVLCHPITGRTHQLRVHLSSLGCPILGDTLYGNQEGSALIARQALHCISLSFPHPTKKSRMTVHAPLLPDMIELSGKELSDASNNSKENS